jgi:hypothetical protein
MLKKTFKIPLVIIFFLFAHSFEQAYCKPKVFAEGGIGLNYNSYVADFNGFPGYDCCGHFTKGNGFGFSTSFTGIYNKFLSLRYFDIGAFASIYFQSLSGKFSYDEYFADAIINEQVYKAISRHTLETTLYPLGINPGIEINNIFAIKPLFVRAGLILYFPIYSKFSQKEELVSPKEAYFENNQKLRNVFNDKINNINSPFYSINFLIGWKNFIGNSFYLSPSISFDIPLNEIAKGTSWKNYKIALGIALGYKIPSEKPQPPLPPHIPDFPTPLIPKQSTPIEVEIIVKSENNSLIRNHDTISFVYNIKKHIQLTPMPMVLFYNKNDFLFGADTLETTEVYKHYYETNNRIISAIVDALKKDSTKRIILLCSQSGDEQENICQLRLARLIEYFRSHNLDSRIKETKTIIQKPRKYIPELIEEQRNIQILFDDGRNVVNIATTSIIDTTTQLPKVFVQTNVSSDVPHKVYGAIKFQKETITFLDSFLLDFSSFTELDTFDVDSVTITAKVITQEEIPQTVDKSIWFNVKKETYSSDEYYYYNPFNGKNFIIAALFEFDKSQPYWVNPELKQIISQLTMQGKKIEIVGSVDNLGTESHNTKLAAARAKSISYLLGQKFPTSIMEKEQRNNNQNPINRLLNRSAWIHFED